MLAAITEPEVDDSDDDSVYTSLDGGAVTEERLLDEAAGKAKRRLVPLIDLAVRKRDKAGTYRDLFQAGDNLDEPIVVDNDGPAPQSHPDEVDHQGSPKLRARFSLPKMDTAHSDGQADDDESKGSESEVWAELEDDLANTAVTPAAFPMDDDDISDPEDTEQAPQVEDETYIEPFGEPPTPYESYSTPAAYLGVDDPEDDEESESIEPTTESRDEPMELDGDADEDDDDDEDEQPRWPGPEDVDIESEFASMFDNAPTAEDVSITTDTPAESEPEEEAETAPQSEAGEDGMEIDHAQEGSVDDDDTPSEPQAAVINTDLEARDVVEDRASVTAEVEIGETADSPDGPDDADAVADQASAVQEDAGSVSSEPVGEGPSSQPDAVTEVAGASDGDVPDFAGLFGKTPTIANESSVVEAGSVRDAPLPSTEPLPTAAIGAVEDTTTPSPVSEEDSPVEEHNSVALGDDTISSELGTSVAQDVALESSPLGELTKEAEPPLDGDSPVERSEPAVDVIVTETISETVGDRRHTTPRHGGSGRAIIFHRRGPDC